MTYALEVHNIVNGVHQGLLRILLFHESRSL